MRYIDPKGSEGTVNSIADYLAAVKSGHISPDSLVFDEETKKWVRADTTSEYRSLQAGRAVDGAKETHRKVRRLSWLGWGLFATTFVVAFTMSSAPGDSGRRLGQSLVFLLLAGAIAGLIVRRSSRLVKAGAFAVVMAGFFGYNAWGVYEGQLVAAENRQAKVAIAEAVSKIEKMNVSAIQDVRPAAPALNSQPVNQSQGWASVMRLLPKYREQSMQLRADLDRSVAEIQLDQMLLAQRLVSAEGVARSQATAERYEKLVAGYDDAYDATQAALRAEAVAATVGTPQGETFLAGFDESSAANRKLKNEWVQLQRELMRESRKILDIAKRNVGRSRVQGDTFLLPTEKDAASYNAAIDSVLRLSEREEALTKRAVQAEAKALDQMRAMAAK